MTKQAQLILRDTTLREGLDVPNVVFSLAQRLSIVSALTELGVQELEVVAPARVDDDLPVASAIREQFPEQQITGLLYAASPRLEDQVRRTCRVLSRVEVLVSASPQRRPFEFAEKLSLLRSASSVVARLYDDFGAGFPNSSQVTVDQVKQLVSVAVESGANRITIYDTNGSADPFSTHRLVQSVVETCPVPVFFHGHNDLGMATANTLAAIMAGASGADVTLNGLGDRAGNCSLEQIAVCLHTRGYDTGIDFRLLKRASESVAIASGLSIGPLSPVTGAYIFSQESPGHLENPSLFYAFDPQLLCAERLPGGADE